VQCGEWTSCRDSALGLIEGRPRGQDASRTGASAPEDRVARARGRRGSRPWRRSLLAAPPGDRTATRRLTIAVMPGVNVSQHGPFLGGSQLDQPPRVNSTWLAPISQTPRPRHPSPSARTRHRPYRAAKAPTTNLHQVP
jgi:hypothetical protein